MTSLGGLLLIALVVTVATLCYKVREQSGKIKEIEEGSKKLG